MNRLFRVLHRWKCKTAAHKLALDALRGLDGEGRRAGLFLWHVEPYLRGVDAPEAEFRDFTNHVLYPVDHWGGAARLAQKWYDKTVERLRTRDWPEAAHAAGVTVRYVTFAFSPPRTGHDPQALAFRRPIEWCLSRLYDDLAASAPDDTKPVRIPNGDDWLERLLTSAAEDAYCHLRTVAAKFDFDAVAKRPAALDDELHTLFAKSLTRAAATAGAVLDRAFTEAAVDPPRRWLAPAGLLALPSLPLFWLTRSQARSADRRVVRAMHREFTKTGAIEDTLPDDAKSVRDAYELEVLKKTPRKPDAAPTPPARSASEGRNTRDSQPARPASPKPEGRTPERATPHVASPPPRGEGQGGGKRPSIPPLAKPPEIVRSPSPAPPVPRSPASPPVEASSDEAHLLATVPALTPTEARLLVACGVTGPEDLAALSPVELWELVVPVAESPDGRRLLQGASPPSLDTVTHWIDAAQHPRKAA